MQAKSWLSLVLVTFVLTAFLGACAEPTPEERVASLRARYEASLNGFLVEQRPVVELAPSAEMESVGELEEMEPESEAEPVGDEEAMVEEMAVEEESVDLVQDVLLDIVIRHESPEKLDGVTVDITMADGERELQTWRAWFDTSKLEKGPGFQYSYKLEDVDYQPGYGFSAEIRYPIPPEERSEYREFSNLGG